MKVHSIFFQWNHWSQRLKNYLLATEPLPRCCLINVLFWLHHKPHYRDTPAFLSSRGLQPSTFHLPPKRVPFFSSSLQ